MRAQMDMVFMLITALVIGLLVFGQIIPFAAKSMEAGAEPLPGMDAKITYDSLIGSAFTLNTYTFATSMPRDGEGKLAWEQVNRIEQARAESIFKSEIGKTFVRLMYETQYLEKHRFHCLYGCTSLSICSAVGESIYGTSPTITEEDQIQTVLVSATGDCLRVADYLVRRSQHLAKIAEATSGSLSGSWTETPP